VPSGKLAVGSYFFDLKALSSVTTTISTFDEAISVTLSYTSSDVTGLEESNLTIYRWDGSTWSALSGCSTNTSAKTVTCQTTAFSVFGLFGETEETEEANSSSGGLSPGALNRFVLPYDKKNILINGGVLKTQSADIVLSLYGGSSSVKMAISNSPDFYGADLIPYQNFYNWNLCWDFHHKPTTCSFGKYIVYVKFYNTYGISSDVVSANIEYIQNNNNVNDKNNTENVVNKPCTAYLTKNLSYKAKNNSAEVKKLQQFLSNNFSDKIVKINGIFDLATEKSVIKFQEKYYDEILKPSGLKKGTGMVYPYTIKKINQIMCSDTGIAQENKVLPVAICSKFIKNFKLNSKDSEVIKIKQFLKDQGFYNGNLTAVFDSTLLKAVNEFQMYYSADILNPLGLKKPTGNWYSATIKKANSLLNCR
jgi:peptidoglycan hydrolase-like protein with peptidoglycan-binding domain